ncbi:type II CRISPR RNA-guided endonuclease Cas9 [Hydrogenimonas sp.]
MSKTILAVDLGVTSFGYAILRESNQPNQYYCLDNNVVMRDAPYNERGDSSQGERSAHRALRRLVEKRKKRIKCVSKTFEAFGILDFDETMAINDPKNNPIKNRWELRAVDTWERILSPEELFAVFAHMAKHRGYKSIATDDLLYELERDLGLLDEKASGDVKEDEKRRVYQALDRLKRLRREYQTDTIAQTIHWAVQQGKFRSYRNHDDYEKMIRREDIEEEIEKIVAKQSELGAITLPTERLGDFIDALQECITDQKMPTNDENLFGNCTFYYDEKAAPRYSYLYDLFRLYKKLADLRIDHYEVTSKDRERIVQWVEEHIAKGKNVKKITHKDIRKILGLAEHQKIFGQDDERIVKQGKKEPRTFLPFFFISDIAKFKELFSAIVTRDDVYYIMKELSEILQYAKTPQESHERIKAFLEKHDIEASDKEIVELFKNKKPGTLELSHRYILEALPLFLEGMDEKEIQCHLGLEDSEDFSRYPKSLKHLHLREDNLFEQEENPISNHAIKSLASWALGLIADLSWRYGPFDEIVIESARDILPEKIRKAIEKAMREREKNLKEIVEKYKGQFPTIDKRLARKIQLWEQQKELDLYTGKTIGLSQLLDGSADIEHIVARTLGGLSTGYNTIVALKDANIQKGNRLPGDWLGGDTGYCNRVEMLFKKGLIDWKKRKNLLVQSLDEIYTETFDTKGLRATSYLEALVAQVLKRYYPFPDAKARRHGTAVRMIPGKTTSRARSLLRVKSKSRETNWHHAEDAMILATISRGWQNRLHRILKENYGKSEEDLKELWKKHEPHIEGLSLRDYIEEAYERFMSKGEESLFYRDMFGGIRSVSYWVNKKPLSASSHKDTVYSGRHDVPTLRKNILDAFAALDVLKERHKLSADAFMKRYDKDIRQKLWLHRIGNVNDESYLAVERRAAQIAETLTTFQLMGAKNDKEIDKKFQTELRELITLPIEAEGKSLRKMRFVYDRLNAIQIDRGLVETDKNLLAVVFERIHKEKLSISKVDVNSLQRLHKQDAMIVYLNEVIYLFNKKKTIHYGALRSFSVNNQGGKYIKLFNPRYPSKPKAQPKMFTTGSSIRDVSVGSATGVIKVQLDISGKVKSYQKYGSIPKELELEFIKKAGYGGVEDDTDH